MGWRPEARLTLALSQIAATLVGELMTFTPAWWLMHARPGTVEVPIYVEPAAQTDPASAQRNQSATPEVTEGTESARGRRCTYCGVGGLTATEAVRHGRVRARNGVCP